MGLADNIRYYRKQAGLHQAALGQKLGVSAQAVSKWELGKAEPDRESIASMCSLFGISSDALLGIQSNQNEELTDDEMKIREMLRRDPSYRLLFSAADKASPEHIRAAAAMLKALEPGDD